MKKIISKQNINTVLDPGPLSIKGKIKQLGIVPIMARHWLCDLVHPCLYFCSAIGKGKITLKKVIYSCFATYGSTQLKYIYIRIFIFIYVVWLTQKNEYVITTIRNRLSPYIYTRSRVTRSIEKPTLLPVPALQNGHLVHIFRSSSAPVRMFSSISSIICCSSHLNKKENFFNHNDDERVNFFKFGT